MPTYAIIREDEFIISLTRPADDLLAHETDKISLCLRNPHNGREDELAHSVLTKILRLCISEVEYDRPTDQV
jgi:hypothetical protein